ncbi:polysaccharide pyruvyl transferase CsaB [Paenibacillus sp. S3N08]|uniref:Polysaccharide pyruvyl transferase CsaB n=1 Tax=Paenibacillus agricola TaxID=2716264 RepID=A0ABX0JHM0_9BACL|nr:polysaccharide pyruvyl transferase CsaB [Paenibacillus agricola]
MSGYYGFDNSGDEAVLQSILLALDEQGKSRGIRFVPVVLSNHPARTSQTYNVEAIHRMKPAALIQAIRNSDGLISGGGSLLQDATGAKTIPYYLAIIKLAQFLGKPTFIYSQGIGPVHRGMFFGWIKSVFNRCQLISVRDEESKQLLLQMKVKRDIMVVPDPVMGMPLATQSTGQAATDRSEASIIGVSVRYWNQDRSELDSLAEAITLILQQTKAQIRFLPFHLPSDEEASHYIRKQLDDQYSGRITTATGVSHPQQMLAEVGRCHVLIGMRLHALIYAASQQVPMLGISYDPKIDQFLNRLDMKAVANTTTISAQLIASETARLLQQRLQWQLDKQPLIERLKSEAQTPAQQIALFFNKGRDFS